MRAPHYITEPTGYTNQRIKTKKGSLKKDILQSKLKYDKEI